MDQDTKKASILGEKQMKENLPRSHRYCSNRCMKTFHVRVNRLHVVDHFGEVSPVAIWEDRHISSGQ